MKLLLIRHGYTQANVRHLYCGSSDIPLSFQGAEALHQAEYAPPPDCIYITSGMLRTEQTLEILFGNVSHIKFPELREPDFGIFEMKSYEQLKNNPDYLKWISGDFWQNTPPGGESAADMSHRVLEKFHELYSVNKNLVIVTHGGVISVLMQHIFPDAGKNFYSWQPHPGKGYEIDTETGTYRPVPEET